MADLSAALAVLRSLELQSPIAPGVGTRGGQEKANKNNSVPIAPAVPGALIDIADVLERAAILEFDGGLSRAQADRLALAEFGLTTYDDIADPSAGRVTA